MRICDWSSDVCSSDLSDVARGGDQIIFARDLLLPVRRDDAVLDRAIIAGDRNIAAVEIIFGGQVDAVRFLRAQVGIAARAVVDQEHIADRKSTRLKSSHYCAKRMQSHA